MGLLDSVVGSLTAGNAQGGNGLLDTVMQLIQNQPGGLAGSMSPSACRRSATAARAASTLSRLR